MYLADLVGVHDGSAKSFDVTDLGGIVAFPSYHAVLGVLLTYAHRGGVLLWPVAALNAVMLVSIPSEGGHYLIDLVAGVPTAVFTIVAIRGAQLDRAGMMRPVRA
jgi:membrane-associated phospholipid phosphatase